jgi:hypothetical protein
MNRHTGRLAVLLIPLISLTACASGPQQTTRLLDHRLQMELATDVAAGRAVVEKVEGGNRVTLLGPASFAADKRALNDQTPDVRANVIQALLDPSLMRVQVTDTSSLPVYQRDTRVANVQRYFTANGLGGVLVPVDAAPAPAGPAGLVLMISVQCPQSGSFKGYGDGKSRPVCD